MLRPGGVARPALARAFTTKLSWAGSPRSPTLVMTEWLIVTYHCRTFTGWTGSLMGCEQRRKGAKTREIFSHKRAQRPLRGDVAGLIRSPFVNLVLFCGNFCSSHPRLLNRKS